MRHLQGLDRGQTALLPPAIDDYVHGENPVRFLDAFVDGLDLKTLGFGRVEPNETGRPSYHPADLLKLYLYGYLNRVRSSRRLETETHRNLEVIWLLRGLRPDHKTIANFRQDNLKAFKAVFRRFVVLCQKLDLFDFADAAFLITDCDYAAQGVIVSCTDWHTKFSSGRSKCVSRET
jgi:transposase